MYVYVRVYMYACICMYIHVYVCVYMHICMCVCMYLYICMYVYVCSNVDSLYFLDLTEGRGESVTHFLFLHHFSGSHYRVMCICKYEMMSKMSVRVLYCGNIYEWWTWGEEARRRNPVPALAYSYQKTRKGPPRLTSPSDGRIFINSAYGFFPILHWFENCKWN